MAHRKREEPRIWSRSERVFRVNEEWFIHTREGVAVGPYSDKFAADVDAVVLKSLLAEVENEAAAKVVIEVCMLERGKNLGVSSLLDAAQPV
jgi:hypothetical protein